MPAMDSQAIIIQSDHFLLLRLLKSLRGPDLEIFTHPAKLLHIKRIGDVIRL